MATKEEYEYEPVAGNEEIAAKYDVENGRVNIKPAMVATSAVPANRKFLYVAACVGNIAAFVCGTSFGWTSPELPKLQLTPEDGNPLSTPLTESEKSWIGSFLPLGATFAPFAAGILADKIGRKNTLLVGNVPFVIAFLLATFATSPMMFFLMRFVCGLAVGVIFTVLPMYIGEIAEDEVRDSLGSFMQLFIVVGMLFSYALGPYMSVTAFNIVCMLAPCLFLVTFFMFIPESPYYLIRTNKDKAQQSLMKLRAASREHVQKELEDIKVVVDDSMANKLSFNDIFKSKGLTKALTISVGLVTFQQFSGINVILFYTQTIFQNAGSTISPEICVIIIGVFQIFGSAATPILVEKKGKRFLLILSGIGMALSQGILAVFFFLQERHHDLSSIGWIPMISLIAYIVTYCMGFGPLPWAVMGELFPDNIKSSASTVTAAVCWFFGFLLTKYFSMVSDCIGDSGSFGIFAGCCIAAAIFVFTHLPDTSGKSLQEIQDILNGNVPKP